MLTRRRPIGVELPVEPISPQPLAKELDVAIVAASYTELSAG
jgi:hypothetical protein